MIDLIHNGIRISEILDVKKYFYDSGSSLIYELVNQGAMPTDDKNHEKQRLLRTFRSYGKSVNSLVEKVKNEDPKLNDFGNVLFDAANKIEKSKDEKISEIRETAIDQFISNLDNYTKDYITQKNIPNLKYLLDITRESRHPYNFN